MPLQHHNIYIQEYMLETIKARYKSLKEQRFLKRHGCETWKEYNIKYDPDYNIRATRIVDIYHGYPYVYCFENRNHQVYWWDLAYDGSAVVYCWCEENLKDKFRLGCHRVVKYPSTNNQWEVNELGGGDYIFAAFKDPKDYTHFLLRWA